MTWDSQNRMVSYVKNGVTSTFEYGSDGLRRKMTVGANLPVHYLIDGQNVVRELQDVNENGRFYDELTGDLESGEALATYLVGPRGVEYRWDHTAQEGDERRWYVYDGLGCVIGEVDDTGELTAQQTYYAFGGIRSGSGSSASSHKFCGSLGHTADSDTGLAYMRARYYDPVIGRFISEDPASQGVNWYAYCGDNPVNRVDYTGRSYLDWWPLFGPSELLVGGILIKLGEYYAGREGLAEVAAICLGISGNAVALIGAITIIAGIGNALGHMLSNYVDRLSTMIWTDLERSSQQIAASVTERVVRTIEGYQVQLIGYWMQAEAGQ